MSVLSISDKINAMTCTTTPAHKFVYTSNGQRFARIGPLKRFRHGGVEIVDKVHQCLVQVLGGLETGAFEQAPDQDTKPNLDLIEPGAMLGGIYEADPMTGIGE